jgi:hypothetical protein
MGFLAIIKQKMNVTRSLLEDIKTKQLKWYGHGLMEEDWNDRHKWKKKII